MASIEDIQAKVQAAVEAGQEYVAGVGWVSSFLSYMEGKPAVVDPAEAGPGSGVDTGSSGALGSAGGVSRSSAMVNKQANNDAIPVMYGKQRMGGTRIFVAGSDGAGNEQTKDSQGVVSNTSHLNMVLCVAEGEMGEIQEVYFNETKIWDLAGNGSFVGGRGADEGEELTGFEAPYDAVSGFRIFYYSGKTTQTYCTELEASVSTWGPDGTGDTPDMSEIAYLALILPADEVFGGQLPSVTCVLEGKKILDVSTISDGAPTGSWQTTGGADQNPVDVLYDYLTADKFGKGMDRVYNTSGSVVTSTRFAGQDIDIASFQQARIDCDAARSSSGYPFNGFLSTNRKMYDNVGDILAMCNGLLLFIDGKYHLKIRKQNEHVGLPDYKIFTTDDILSPIGLVLPTKSTKLNKATGIYGGSGTDWNDDLVVYSPPAYLAADNDTVLENKQDFGLITDEQFVLDMITQRVDYSRVLETITFTASHRAIQLLAGDVIEVRNSDYGWGTGAGETQHYWRITDLVLNEDNTVQISASTYDSSKEL
jgi:hypothetical protein